MKLLLDNKYIIEFNEKKEIEKNANGTLNSYLEAILNRPKDVQKEVYCFLQIVKQISRINQVHTVVEYFGGGGFMSTFIQKILNPTQHMIFDINKSCINHLQHNFSNTKGISINIRDSLNSDPIHNMDLSVIDCNFTLKKILKEEPHKSFIHNVFTSNSKFISYTDASISHYFPNRKLYSQWLGKMASADDYFIQLAKYFKNEFGYFCTYAIYHNTSSFMLLQQTKPLSDMIICKVPKVINALQMIDIRKGMLL